MRAGVLTTSDRCSRGERKDESGPVLTALLRDAGFEVIRQVLVPDEAEEIKEALLDLCDHVQCDLVVTTGGTGMHPRDVTPEATRELVHKLVPGIGEAMRAESIKKTPFGMISRGIAGVRAKTFIVNFPGSPKAIRETFPVIRPVLAHVVSLLAGGVQDCAPAQPAMAPRWERESKN